MTVMRNGAPAGLPLANAPLSGNGALYSIEGKQIGVGAGTRERHSSASARAGTSQAVGPQLSVRPLEPLVVGPKIGTKGADLERFGPNLGMKLDLPLRPCVPRTDTKGRCSRANPGWIQKRPPGSPASMPSWSWKCRPPETTSRHAFSTRHRRRRWHFTRW